MRGVEGVDVHECGGVKHATVASEAPASGEEEGEEVEEGVEEEEDAGEEEAAGQAVLKEEGLHFGEEVIEGGDGLVGGFAGFGQGAGEVLLLDGGWCGWWKGME